MAELTLQDITRDGLDPDMESASADGDTFPQSADGRVFLLVKNDGSSSREITVNAENDEKQVAGWGTLTASDAVVSVPGGEQRLIGPFPAGPYTQTPDVSYDDETDVTVAAIRLPKE